MSDQFTCVYCQEQRDAEEDSFMEVSSGENAFRICMSTDRCATYVEEFTEILFAATEGGQS